MDALHHDCHAAMATLVADVAQALVVPPYLDRLGRAAAEIVDPQHLAELTAELPPAVQQALGLRALVQTRLRAAVTREVSLQVRRELTLY